MIEKGVGFKNTLRDLKNDFDRHNLGAGIVAAIFGLSAGVVHISAANSVGLPSDFTMIWVTALYFINGLFGVLVASYYRQPLPMANSFPGVFLFVAFVANAGLAPTLGGTLVAGFLAFLIGFSGAMGKIMRFTPTPIVMGMISGILLSFGLDLVTPLEDSFLPAALMIGTYLLIQRFYPKFPAIVGALITGVIYMFIVGVDFTGVSLMTNYPRFSVPEFDISVILSYGIPLTIILVGVETPAGVGLLKAAGYKKSPANGITAANGIGTMVSAFFNLHNTCIAAPMTAITSSPEAGKLDKRWVSAVLVGLIWMAAAPFYGSLVTLFEIMPPFFINIIAGLALLKVLVSTFGNAFGTGGHTIGALFAFLIAASEIELLNIGAPLWSLVIGILVSLILETKDFDFNFADA
ncbi:benzoate/H(+) symporter BenE family transporter [Natranaerofaba carboxydovora]|uniref:benzoate/H(+) symporter BenE family transporter n=1 Tax=Natranaerofaba carboxydovora TaxID=2742683 RepID=UPI001F141727|nr:benzoate/H(+) symporter BenE family transporter [Natranaerofaba carboxydovora]UMZ74765.1 Inner membrane protein YdcO [Natranaerofaba carboxydovora]